MLRYLLGLIYYQQQYHIRNSGKNYVNLALSIHLHAQVQWLKTNFSRLIFVRAHAGYLVNFTEAGKSLLLRPQGE